MLTHDFISSVYENTPTSKNMDNNSYAMSRVKSSLIFRRNCLRRIASHQETEFSSQSIMKVMDNFVQAVQDMDETILVPCRLMDLEVGDATDKVEVKFAQKGDGMYSTDLHSLYSLVNCVKTELLWGANDQHYVEDNHMSMSAPPTMKTHIRRPSTASMASTNSAGSTISDTDSEIGIENDSGIEGDSESNTKPSYTQKVEQSFRRHLYGLHRSLEQMTEAAVYLTKRYQNDVGGTV